MSISYNKPKEDSELKTPFKSNEPQVNSHERMSDKYNNPERDIRETLTKFITYSVVGITILIAIVPIIISLCKKAEPDYDLISKTFIPLWASWIGTVLAFYFGKANFKAATDSYESIIDKLSSDERLAQTPISKVMIPYDAMEKLYLANSLQMTIRDILDLENFKPYNRYAVVDNSVLQYIIHRQHFAQYISDTFEEDSPKGINPKDIKFEDFLADCKISNDKLWLGQALYISINDNMLSAAKMIASNRNVRDVFVTQSGRKGEQLLGLITDANILKVMKG